MYAVYIVASGPRGTLYIGVSNNLIRRVYEHKNHLITGFTDRYNVDCLVYFELHQDVKEAIKREKQLKILVRRKKIELIEKTNPTWRDFYDDLI